MFDGENSELFRALTSSTPPSVTLAVDNMEHQRFLVCLTYHMTKWRKVAVTLSPELTESEIESIAYNQRHKLHEEAFEMMQKWISNTPTDEAKVSTLLRALKQNDYEIKIISRTEEYRVQHLLPLVGKLQLTCVFTYEVAMKVCLAWMTLGRLLGLPAMDVTCQLQDSCTEKATRQACEMLDAWKKQTENANYATFVRALSLLFVLDSPKARIAWDHTVDHLNNLACNSCAVPYN